MFLSPAVRCTVVKAFLQKFVKIFFQQTKVYLANIGKFLYFRHELFSNHLLDEKFFLSNTNRYMNKRNILINLILWIQVRICNFSHKKEQPAVERNLLSLNGKIILLQNL